MAKKPPFALVYGDAVKQHLRAIESKFQALLDKSRRQIEETGGIPHEQFWREVEAETRGNAIKGKQAPRRTKRRT